MLMGFNCDVGIPARHDLPAHKNAGTTINPKLCVNDKLLEKYSFYNLSLNF